MNEKEMIDKNNHLSVLYTSMREQHQGYNERMRDNFKNIVNK